MHDPWSVARPSTATDGDSVERMKHRIRIAMQAVEWVIAAEGRLLDDAIRRDRAQDRLLQAERERSILDAELAALERGNVQAAIDLHETYMRDETASRGAR